MASKVLGLKTRCSREGLNLQEVDLVASMRFLRVGYAGAGGSELEVTALEDLSIAYVGLLRSDANLVGN